MSEGIGDVLVLVPYRNPFGTVTFEVCGLDDLMRYLLDADDQEPDDMREGGIVGAIQRAGIDAPTSVGTPTPEEMLRLLERAGDSNSAEGRFTYWDAGRVDK